MSHFDRPGRRAAAVLSGAALVLATAFGCGTETSKVVPDAAADVGGVDAQSDADILDTGSDTAIDGVEDAATDAVGDIADVQADVELDAVDADAIGQPDAPTGTQGSGAIGNAQVVVSGATAFFSPFDAALDDAGKIVYFTAIAGDPSGTPLGALFQVSATGAATPTPVLIDDILVAPMALAVGADNTVYIADAAAGTNDSGIVFAVLGGKATAMQGTDGLDVVGLSVAGKLLYLAGAGADGLPTVWSMPADGTAKPTVIAAGTPLITPGGISVAANGDVYVADTGAGPGGLGAIVRVIGGQASVWVSGLSFGFPSGIAVAQDGSAVLASVYAPTGSSAIVRVDVASKAMTFFTKGIDKLSEPGGLHRAANQDVYVWVDAEAAGNGAVHLLTK